MLVIANLKLAVFAGKFNSPKTPTMCHAIHPVSGKRIYPIHGGHGRDRWKKPLRNEDDLGVVYLIERQEHLGKPGPSTITINNDRVTND